MSGRFFVETWGCQMNELDSQRMAGQLIAQGMVPVPAPAEADIILLNSCSVREKAEHKVYSRLGEYRRFKRARPEVLLGLCGCVAQEAGERALERVPDLDFVVGPSRVGELGEVLARRRAGERPVFTGFPDRIRYELDAISRDGSHKGMITVVEGCDKKCTFCIVPLTRGPERSRPLEQIVAEARRLVGEGFVEIELLGQTVNHWREPGGREDFADLLDAVCAVDGVKRLRFVTSYPRDFTPRMVERFARHAVICPALHLPVQSGSDPVLRRMGRGYTAGEYRRLVADLRRARPGLALATDMIVGFPGETEEDFEATLALVEEIRFASVFAFRYSPRPGTAAPGLSDPVPDEVAGERLQRLLAQQQEIQRELNRELEGRVLETLVTAPGRRPEMLTGRTPCHRLVHFPSPSETAPIGSLLPVRVDQALPHSLLGSPVPTPA